MRIALLVLILLLIVFGPQIWTKRVFARYATQRDDYPGTGGELARHLLDQFDMKHVKVEQTDTFPGDHYDPQTKTVRLTPDKLNGKSLTAVTVAAHEVGHAIQDYTGYQPLVERTRLVRLAQGAEKVRPVMMLGVPIAAGLTRAPAAGVVVHLVTLPVEWDASFRRALPVLEKGQYLSHGDMTGARKILTAAALTYVAASLASLLNLWRWIALLRR